MRNRISLLILLLCFAIQVASAADWPQWRGPGRDGITTEVPQKLPAKKLLWRKPMSGIAHGGIAVCGRFVVVPDYGDGKDIFRCYSADKGEVLWTHAYPNKAEIEWGPSPRATPLIADNRVYTLGAAGDLYCLELETGKIVWKMNFVKDFKAEVPQYGYCSSPLLADGKLIVNPGGKEASLAALDTKSDRIIWQTPGNPAAYASFITGSFGGVTQVIGYDKDSLGGWELATGKRLWTVKPENENDFNVSTPVNVNGKLLVATDTNQARLFTFGKDGAINPKPAATSMDLGPDMATPLAYKDLIFGSTYAFMCIDPGKGLKMLWKNETEEALMSFSSIVAGNDRLLVFTESGAMFLLAADGKKCQIIGRMDICQKTWSHPALANGALFIRDEKWVYAYSL